MQQQKILSLNVRIMNCLQTILDLESTLRRLELGGVLLSEFTVLKDFLKDVESIELDEEDVARIENATEHFLQELKMPLSLIQSGNAEHYPVQ